MNKKTVSISLPQIEGVELKNATVDLENGVVVAEYGEKTLSLKVKKGDVIYQNAPDFTTQMIIIINEDATIMGGINDMGTCIAMIGSRGGLYFNGDYFGTHGITELRFATESEKQTLFDALKKKAKRYNPDTFKIEDLDISEIATDFISAADYLYEDIHQFTIGATKNHSSKLSALNQLMILAEAWNSFDKFKPDWEDRNQCKYYPLFEFINGKFEFAHVDSVKLMLDPHASNFSFKTEERAEQFGKQFIDLFRIVLSN